MGTGICPFCGKKVDKFIMFRGDVIGCRYCGIHTKQTNADRIRGMSDEELADWLGVYCNGQTAQEVGKPCVSGMGSCEECWLDWLKEEAKDD